MHLGLATAGVPWDGEERGRVSDPSVVEASQRAVELLTALGSGDNDHAFTLIENCSCDELRAVLVAVSGFLDAVLSSLDEALPGAKSAWLQEIGQRLAEARP